MVLPFLSTVPRNHIWFGNVPFLSTGIDVHGQVFAHQSSEDSVFPGVNPGSEAFLGCSKVPVLLPGVPTLAACGFKDRGDCQNSGFFFVPAFLCRRRGQGCLCVPLVVFPGALLVTDIC